MISFTTTSEQKLALYEIATQMHAVGLSADFIAAAVKRAEEYEGTFELMALWRDEADPDERAETLADIQEAIEDGQERPERSMERPYIHFNDLQTVADKVRVFKAELRKKVDAWGGVMKLAAETGIPQPSLSRFFNSSSMPRRTTLYRIAKVIGLSEKDIATDWLR
ncbi:MAG: helix-turn-helix domain-containing protein [Candidatus Sericytochromatia bacterium]